MTRSKMLALIKEELKRIDKWHSPININEAARRILDMQETKGMLPPLTVHTGTIMYKDDGSPIIVGPIHAWDEEIKETDEYESYGI